MTVWKYFEILNHYSENVRKVFRSLEITNGLIPAKVEMSEKGQK